ncbi:glycosyltransferase [Crocinitomix sp.]|nr:glycosyltransferase [Crocinitomix sp.]
MTLGKNQILTLSVLLPNYNNALYLKEALDSLFNQTVQGFVIYFVDDGSTDDSIEIAKSYNDNRLVIIEKKSNTGIVDTLNIGLDLIDTEFFIRMDGDDISAPDRFEKLIEFMNTNPNINICGSDIQNFGIRESYNRYETDSNKIKAQLIFGHGVGHASAIFRTKVLKDNNIKYKDDFKRLEDYYLFFRLKDFGVCSNISEPLYFYRQEVSNNNPEIREMMKLEYKKMYFLVLTELFGEVNETDLSLHIGLSKKGDVIHDFKEYKCHCERLISENKKKKIYPLAAFNSLIKSHLDTVRFKLIDRRQISLGGIVQGVFKGEVKFLKYYLSSQIKRNK